MAAMLGTGAMLCAGLKSTVWLCSHEDEVITQYGRIGIELVGSDDFIPPYMPKWSIHAKSEGGVAVTCEIQALALNNVDNQLLSEALFAPVEKSDPVAKFTLAKFPFTLADFLQEVATLDSSPGEYLGGTVWENAEDDQPGIP